MRLATAVGVLLAPPSALATWAQSSPCNIPPWSWTDDPIVAGGTTLKAVHLNEIRAALEDLRLNCGGGDGGDGGDGARVTLNTVVTGVSIDGRAGRWDPGDVPPESGGPAVGVAGNAFAVNGGTADLTVTGTGISGMIVTGDPAGAGYYDVVASGSDRVLLRLSFAREIARNRWTSSWRRREPRA